MTKILTKEEQEDFDLFCKDEDAWKKKQDEKQEREFMLCFLGKEKKLYELSLRELREKYNEEIEKDDEYALHAELEEVMGIKESSFDKIKVKFKEWFKEWDKKIKNEDEEWNWIAITGLIHSANLDEEFSFIYDEPNEWILQAIGAI